MYYDTPISKPLQWLGCFELSRRLVRFRWGEVSWRWGVSLKLASFEDGYSLIFQPIFGKWFIKLPRFLPHSEPHELMESWGFSWGWFNGDIPAIHFNWGTRSKVIFMPWRWEHYRTEVYLTNKTWRKRKDIHLGTERKEYDSASDPLPDVWVERHPYHYLLPDGEVQHVTATVTVNRTENRIACLKRLPWPRKRSQHIDVWFSDEVGERAGSWKGGCLGCGYTMSPGETPRDTLKRMQAERRFR